MKESIIQQQICEFLSLKQIFYFSIPNEHYNISHAQRTQLKKMGLVPGMPDLAVLHDSGIYFFEVKNEKGTLSKSQYIIRDRLLIDGYHVAVVRSVEEVEEILKRWCII